MRVKAYTAGQSSIAADGGETIPSPLADYYMKLLRDARWVRNLTREFKMKENTLEIPRQLTGMTMYAVAEGTNMTTEGGATGTGDSTTKSTLDSIVLNNYKMGVIGGYTTELAEDSLIDIGKFVVENGALAMAEGEEKAFIWGDTTGAIATYSAGQPEKFYDGLIHQIPSPDGTAVSSLWTPVNNGYDNIIAGGSQLLTLAQINDMLSRVEDQAGNGAIDTILVPPKIAARLRHPLEFEPFATLDKIGNKASVVANQVGEMYGARIVSTAWLPVGGKTSPTTATGTFVSGATDGMIVGFDSKTYAAIGQRREIELRTRHDFYRDVEELRWLERVGWKVLREQHTAMVHNVKNSAV